MNWKWVAEDQSWYDHATPYHIHRWGTTPPQFCAYRSGLPVKWSLDAEELKRFCEADAAAGGTAPVAWTVA